MLLLAMLGTLAAATGAWFAYRLAPRTPQLVAGTWMPQPRALRAFALRDTSDRVFGAAELAAQPSLLFFGFTQCPDVCPTTLAMLAQLQRNAQLPGLRIILVSVDPQRDTVSVLRQYLTAFDGKFIGLTGSVPAIAALARDVGVALTQEPLPGGGYTIDHSATLFLTDYRGRIAAVFTPPLRPDALLADLRSAWPALRH